MADIKLSISVALVIAIAVAEIVSAIWYSEVFPWGKYGTRYFLSGIIADVGLAVLLQNITATYYSVRSIEDAAMLAGWLSLLYACLEAPHCVHDHRSFSRFLYITAHKFLVMFAVALVLHHFKNY